MTLATAESSAAVDALLADGTIVSIRPLKADDGPALLAMNDDLTNDSLRSRFFGASRSAADQYTQHVLSSPDVPALVALHSEEMIGLATAELLGSGRAEVAFLVAEGWHGRGVGSLLLEHLAALARDRGIDHVVADVLLANHQMLEVFAKAGFTGARSIDEGTVHLELETAASTDYLRAADQRECASERESLRGLLHPRSVAVYGVRHDGSGIGASVLHSITEGGFSRPTYVVHPTGGEFEGATTLSSLSEAEEAVDLAVIALPAPLVIEALQDVAAAGTRAVVLISSGFAEIGEAGRRLQRDVLDFARTHDIRVVGPNCLGVAIDDGEVRLDATFGPPAPAPGRLAIASQSGGVGIALMDQAYRLGLGVGAFVSLGNKSDVSGNDLLAAWIDDDAVEAVALYLESFGNASKFARLARRFAQRKPVLAVVGGQSVSGHRAGASHTAAAATPAAGLRALFRQSGVIECADSDELATVALVLAEQPLPAGRRLAIVSNAGGMGCLGADTAERAGLVVPEFSTSTSAAISGHVRGTIGVANPVDAGAGIDGEDFGAIAEACLTSDEVDALLVIVVATGMNDGSGLVASLAHLRALETTKPIVLVPMGGLQLLPLDIPGVTVLPTMRGAVRAIAAAAGYVEWRSSSEDAAHVPDIVRSARARAVVAEISQAGPQHALDGGWLDAGDAQRLLTPYQLAPAGVVAPDRPSALAAARAIGYPVALKVADGLAIHKTDRGLVRTNLFSAAEVERTLDEFASTIGGGEIPVVVQPMADGVELALGVVRDPSFGPLLMVGAGGIATDLSDDRAFLLPPITRREANQTLRSLRLWPLLAGYRGAPARDVRGVEDALLHLASLVEEVPEIAEMDINPLIVGIDRCYLVDVKVRTAQPGIDAGVPRRLRAR